MDWYTLDEYTCPINPELTEAVQQLASEFSGTIVRPEPTPSKMTFKDAKMLHRSFYTSRQSFKPSRAFLEAQEKMLEELAKDMGETQSGDTVEAG